MKKEEKQKTIDSMWKMTLDDLWSYPLLDKNSYFSVKKADSLVSLAKVMSKIVGYLSIKKMDYKGCSPNYVLEKLRMLRSDIDWLIRTVAEQEEEN